MEKCSFVENKESGLLIQCPPKPKSLPKSTDTFLQAHPMDFSIKNCEFKANGKHGCFITDFWKGGVSVADSKFTDNMDSGLCLNSKEFPFALAVKGHDAVSKGTSKVVPFAETDFGPNPLGLVTVTRSLLEYNKQHGLLINKVLTNLKECTFQNNEEFAVFLGS